MELPENTAIDFARPVEVSGAEAPAPGTITAGAETTAGAASESASTPIVLETPEPARPAPAKPLQVGDDVAEPARTVIHEVVAGDTLYDLAIAYNTSIEAIMNANGISSTDTIRVGDQLVVPAGPAE